MAWRQTCRRQGNDIGTVRPSSRPSALDPSKFTGAPHKTGIDFPDRVFSHMTVITRPRVIGAGFEAPSDQRVQAAIPALRRYARALTRDVEVADDLVQDTLVRALRSEHLFQGEEVRSWLYTIMTNLNRNRRRALARRPVLMPLEDERYRRRAGIPGRRARYPARAWRRLARINARHCCW